MAAVVVAAAVEMVAAALSPEVVEEAAEMVAAAVLLVAAAEEEVTAMVEVGVAMARVAYSCGGSRPGTPCICTAGSSRGSYSGTMGGMPRTSSPSPWWACSVSSCRPAEVCCASGRDGRFCYVAKLQVRLTGSQQGPVASTGCVRVVSDGSRLGGTSDEAVTPRCGISDGVGQT